MRKLKWRVLSLILALAMVLTSVPMTAKAEGDTGSGTLDDPYILWMEDGEYSKGELYSFLQSKLGDPISFTIDLSWIGLEKFDVGGFYYSTDSVSGEDDWGKLTQFSTTTKSTDNNSAGLECGKSYNIYKPYKKSMFSYKIGTPTIVEIQSYYDVHFDIVVPEEMTEEEKANAQVIVGEKTIGLNSTDNVVRVEQTTAEAVSLSFSVAEIEGYQVEVTNADGYVVTDLTDDVTVTYSKKPVKVTTTTSGNGTTSIMDGETSKPSPFYANYNDSYVISATPAVEYFVKNIKVNGAEVTEGATYNNSVATVGFTVPENGEIKEYPIYVEYEKSEIKLENTILDYNDKMSADEVKSGLLALVDEESTVPAINGESYTLTVEYNNGPNSWTNDFSYKPSGLEALSRHAFGKSTEKVRFTYDADGEGQRYPTVTFVTNVSLEDNRTETKVNLKADQEVPYKPASPISNEMILEKVFVSVSEKDNEEKVVSKDTKDVNVSITYKGEVLGNEVDIPINASDITNEGTYYVTVKYAGTTSYGASENSVAFKVVDGRTKTIFDVNEEVDVTYGTYTAEDLMAKILEERKGLCDVDGNTIEGEVVFETKDVDKFNVGEHEVTIKYVGSDEYQPATAKIKVIVKKALSSVTIASQVVDHGVSVDNLITVDPADVSYISFLVGLDLDDGSGNNTVATVVHVNLPQLIDLSIVPEDYRDDVEELLAKYSSWEGSLSELKPYLEDTLEAVEKIAPLLQWVGINLDTESIDALVTALESIQDLEGVGDLKLKVSMGQDITPTDAGAYLVGAVTSDSNYETAVNVGYLVIKPNATEVALDFNIKDDNGFITRGSILSGEYDLGTHVVVDEAAGITADIASKVEEENLTNLFITATIDGEVKFIEVLPGDTVDAHKEELATVGAYTQVAYTRDLGNEMYWATPIVRSYAVVTDLVDVKFLVEGVEEPVQRFTFDNTQKFMPATAFDRNGNELDSSDITYTYVGMESDGDAYYSKEAPSQTGLYTVIATYKNADVTLVGVGIGEMIIQPADAAIEVANKVHIYDGNPVDVLGMITKTPEDAKMAVIMAGLDVSGDFSENGLSAVKGVVNIDFPARVDEILAQYVPSAYADGITIDSFINKIDEINTALAEQGMESEYLNEIKGILAQMPNATTLTFKEQSEVNPTSIGAYLVQAVIFDPNYKPEVDTGILVIAPEVKEVVLDWNYTDVNGIITRPILDEVDLGATAFNSADSTKNDEYTGKVKYLFVGVDTEGNQVMTDDASTLPNGAYTQIAYVPAEDVSASMTLVAPIMRSFVIAPQGANVDFVDVNGNDARLFTYDGTPKAMDVEVTDMAGIAIPQELLDKYLTVTYVGVDVEGGYNSTTPPTEIGAYTVTAVYAEYDENGELVRAGMDVGAMVIEPKENGFGVDDTTVPYDGKEHLEEAIVNANDLEYITIITDEENNVNVILPESWGVETTELKLKEGIAAVIKELDKLPEEVKNESAIKAIYNALNKLDEIKSLTLNGAKPVEVGVYNVVGISYGENYKVAVDAGVLTIAQRELNIVIDDKEKVYGDKDPEFTYTVNGIVAGEDVKVDIELVREEGEDVGEYVITIADEATPAATTEEGKSVISNPNYKLGTVTNGTLTINPIEVVITPDALQKYVGETDPAITFKAEGILKGDDVTITVLRADGETAGVYEYVSYVADGEDAGNYTFTLDTTNKFTILEKDNTGEGDKPGDGTKPEDGNKPNDGEASDDKTSADETSKDKVVESGKTGDNANIGLYLGLALAAMAAIVAVLFSRKRSR